MSPRQRLCAVGDLSEGEARSFVSGGIPVCLARCADGWHAVGDVCSHEDYLLGEGEVDPDACEIECWKHGSLFSLETGEPLTLPATRPVPVYEVVVDGEEVFVVLDGEP